MTCAVVVVETDDDFVAGSTVDCNPDLVVRELVTIELVSLSAAVVVDVVIAGVEDNVFGVEIVEVCAEVVEVGVRVAVAVVAELVCAEIAEVGVELVLNRFEVVEAGDEGVVGFVEIELVCIEVVADVVTDCCGIVVAGLEVTLIGNEVVVDWCESFVLVAGVVIVCVEDIVILAEVVAACGEVVVRDDIVLIAVKVAVAGVEIVADCFKVAVVVAEVFVVGVDEIGSVAEVVVVCVEIVLVGSTVFVIAVIKIVVAGVDIKCECVMHGEVVQTVTEVVAFGVEDVPFPEVEDSVDDLIAGE